MHGLKPVFNVGPRWRVFKPQQGSVLTIILTRAQRNGSRHGRGSKRKVPLACWSAMAGIQTATGIRAYYNPYQNAAQWLMLWQGFREEGSMSCILSLDVLATSCSPKVTLQLSSELSSCQPMHVTRGQPGAQRCQLIAAPRRGQRSQPGRVDRKVQ